MTKKIFTWLAITAVVLAVLYFIAAQWFPWLIQKFVALIVGLIIFVTGLFLRRSKTGK